MEVTLRVSLEYPLVTAWSVPGRCVKESALRDTSGTAVDLAGVPGGTLYGKTGTADHGTPSRRKPTSGLIGYQGDLACAILVVNGPGGSASYSPIPLHRFSSLRSPDTVSVSAATWVHAA